ncbi:MAG: RNA-binding protein [Nanoarchaeota archaeon]|nr:RNA-binding protein [Nanoarchaeota archaeon]
MEVSNVTREYLARLFSQDKRFDGRKLLDLREMELGYDVSNKAEGSVRVKFGKTEVIVGVKLAPGEPYPDSPTDGNLMCTAELLLLASSKFEAGPPAFKAIELGRLVDRAIRESGMIEFSKLSISEEKVWTIYVDIYPINDDGNLIDIATIAAVAALRNAKMPSIDKDGNVDYSIKKGSLPLSKDTNPISLSFFKLGDSIILDPTSEEEEACETRVTFGISKWNKQHMINSCQKAGNLPLTQEEISKMMSVIPEKFDELSEKLKKFL